MLTTRGEGVGDGAVSDDSSGALLEAGGLVKVGEKLVLDDGGVAVLDGGDDTVGKGFDIPLVG